MQAHPTAIVNDKAEIGSEVFIGPCCIIGEKVKIGRGTRLIANVIIEGPTEIGEECQFYPFSSIGLSPQDLKFRGEESQLLIGHKNVFREYVTINRGTAVGGGITRIGDNNFFMAYTHIAHDCQVGNHIIMGNAVTLAGHVTIHDHAIIGAFTGLHQFCRAGTHAFIGGYSVITRDALPYVKTVGHRNEAKTYGINSVGLKRKGFSEKAIADLNKAYRTLFRSKLNTSAALAKLKAEDLNSPEVNTLVSFIETCERGFIK